MPVKKVIASPKSKTKMHGYGWVPDVPDQRDYLLSAAMRIPAKLPAKVDLRPLCSKVEDQGQLGSCTANALAGALEFLERKDEVAFEDVSRLFIYYNERAIEHTIASDSGAMIRDGIKTLAKQGVCAEKKWPYVISKFKVKPSPVWLKVFHLSSDLQFMKALNRRQWQIPELSTCPSLTKNH
jgi:C1A family cysteine protease